MLKAKIYVTLKKTILDPQGRAIENSLKSLGFSAIGDVRQGKLIEIDLKTTDREAASNIVDDMCKKLLVNNIVEDYHFDLVDVG